MTRLTAVRDQPVVGEPAAEGRWQPTRAGAVNSWAWADELLVFADGWMTLTGPNGSGKSLTASMLVTLLIDGDTSQTALSVSGKAAGTLTSRHTDRNDREDRTGAWWLEYGMRDEATGEKTYLTTGLWLRAVSGNLQRAFFIAPGRVGQELVLAQQGNPVRVDELAAQLATADGELFTSVASLKSKASGHLTAIGDEPGYRNAVRTRLFAPLDEVQFDALVGVLRSLRSLRTAEAIPPAQMRAVLTEALPALDSERLTVIGEAMERISELETQLGDMRYEAKQLVATDNRYQRYVSAVVELEAAQLAAANTDFDAQTRRTRDATGKLEAAKQTQDDTARRLNELNSEISTLEGRRDAADAALRDHAGAELPLLERRAHELEVEAGRALSRAEEAEELAVNAVEQATAAADNAHEGIGHLAQLTEELRAASREVGADAALERLFDATAVLTASDEHALASVDIEQTCSTPLAWVVMRTDQVSRVENALSKHAEVQAQERSCAEDVRRCERVEDESRQRADHSAAGRQAAERRLTEAISAWGKRATHLGAVPAEVVESTTSEGDRMRLDRISAWITDAANSARSRIDTAGRLTAAETAKVLLEQAQQALVAARSDEAEAVSTIDATAHDLESTRDRARLEEEDDEERRAAATRTYESAVSVAQQELAQADLAAAQARSAADRSAVNWAEDALRWRGGARFLTEVALPEPEPGVDPFTARLAVEQEHNETSGRLNVFLNSARTDVERARTVVTGVESRLLAARRAAPTPAPPPWRTRDDGPGEPLWALVDFADDLTPAETDLIEGALLVAGLLDALVTPDGVAVAGDVVITADNPVTGRSLADLLRLEVSPAVPADRIEALLRSIPADHLLERGHVSTGVLTAAAPNGYQAEFIGRTTRERRRLRLVADLETELDEAVAALSREEEKVATCESDILVAAAERDSFPSFSALIGAREEAARLLSEASATLNRTTRRIAEAEQARAREYAALESAAAARVAVIAAAVERLRHAERILDTAARKTADAMRLEDDRAQRSAEASDALDRAVRAQREADDERQSFPAFDDVRAAGAEEDRNAEDLRRAGAAVLAAAERHRDAGEEVRQALRELNHAASLPDRSLLPTQSVGLKAHGSCVVRLGHQVELWRHAAERSTELVRQARIVAATAAQRAAASGRAKDEAELAKLTAVREAATLAETRQLHGAEYEELRATREKIGTELAGTKNAAVVMSDENKKAGEAAAAARATLEGIAPQREAAERRRDDCVRQIGKLVDERLATMPEDLRDEAGRPAHLTAALSWARRLLQHHSGGSDRLETLRQARARALTQLESTARSTSTALARFDRQVVMETVEGTDWRRAVVADPGAGRGEDLHIAVGKLESTAAQLEEDLRDDVKRTLKTSLFTQLRRDILVRMDAAKELVRQIRGTLAEVRTGVADVGVQVEWVVREEDDAKRMVKLIGLPQSDDVFEDMYTVLRNRMNEKAGDSWKDRVAHTFDYRSWHEWKISVTHASFTGPNQERFREVNARSNPLETLSTGERRLATMLPLLAAAWSMYSGADYRGPRWISIDEIDAAFDEPNLRQVLALLRSWQFDVLATAPFITPMIKKEAGRVVLHEVVTIGKKRITVPWLWSGRGEPQVLTLDLVVGASTP
ncbi:SbcC/MukB-like Walker B domain-containing protein [Lentzea albidocapillata]|uniref:SbcC/MukB-like Walker B domain-containing protein n=1 Tax=Lentzea albidocapillata TaxID=40571 RepID=UPI0006905332|nr:SbcC/MukB-like Walker B domain-containing protein [Lentzea albidocapillata]